MQYSISFPFMTIAVSMNFLKSVAPRPLDQINTTPPTESNPHVHSVKRS